MCNDCEEHKKDKKCCEENKEECCEEKTEQCCNEKKDCCSEENKECCEESPSAEEIIEEVKREDEQEEAKEQPKAYPAEEQGITEETTETTDIKEEMDMGERDENLDTEVGREKQVEDDEINPEEAGFMQGESGAGQLGKDALTGEPLMDIEDVVETEIDGQMYRFVNQENAEEFRKKREKENQ